MFGLFTRNHRIIKNQPKVTILLLTQYHLITCEEWACLFGLVFLSYSSKTLIEHFFPVFFTNTWSGCARSHPTVIWVCFIFGEKALLQFAKNWNDSTCIVFSACRWVLFFVTHWIRSNSYCDAVTGKLFFMKMQ